MNIERRLANDAVLRLAVTGEVDIASANELHDAVTVAVTDGHAAQVIVDLADVTFCDAVGISAIIRARKTATAHAVTVVITNPRGLVRQVFEITGVLDALTNPTPP